MDCVILAPARRNSDEAAELSDYIQLPATLALIESPHLFIRENQLHQ